MIERKEAAVWLIDTQEKLKPHIFHVDEMLSSIVLMLQASSILDLPIIVSEQENLGSTLPVLMKALAPHQKIFSKTTFSGMNNAPLREHILASPCTQWILMGIEAHICVLQTALGLLEHGKEVIVLSDAISSRSSVDLEIAKEEMRDRGVRISSIETILYGMIRDSREANFKKLLPLIKERSCIKSY